MLSYSNNSKICSITFILVVDIEDVVQKTLEELKNNQLIPEYEKNEERITVVLKEAAQTEEKLTKKMVPMIDNTNMREVEQAMSAIIGQDRVDDIKMSFAIETYIMKIVKKSNGQSVVQVLRGGVEFQPEILLKTIADIETATVLQWASLVIEVFFVVLSCAGIRVSLNQAKMRALVKEVKVIVQQSAFQRALYKFLEAWNKAAGRMAKAKAIFFLLKDSYTLGIFWNIIKLIYNDMSTWQKIKAMAELSLTIVSAFATEGIALIARIALAVDSAVQLAQKIANLNKLSDMKKTME